MREIPARCLLAAVIVLAAHHALAQAGGTLKRIDNPGGGHVVYGAIDGEPTPQSAMAFMLKSVHGQFGARPQVSNIFQVRNSSTYAAFFTLIDRNPGGKAIAGEVIVDVPHGAAPAAAVLYDDAQHFTASRPVLLRKLDDAWHSAHPQPALAPATTLASGGALRTQTGGDRSASIGLPDGWRLVSVSGGQLIAEGPNGENIGMGIIVGQIRDPELQYPRYPQMPGAPPAIVCSPKTDLFTAYTCVVNQVRQARHLPAASFHLASSRQLPAGGAKPDVEAIFDVDLHDDKGLRSASARIGTLFTRGLPTWAMTIQNSSVPKTVATAEKSTVTAIINSYRQDAGVINGELQQKLGEIHAIGERSKIQAQAADERRIASSSAFNAHMDDIDRQSKAMQNTTLDRTQIQDNDLNGRATVSNGLADALVRTNPDRYEVVPTANFLKGVDY